MTSEIYAVTESKTFDKTIHQRNKRRNFTASVISKGFSQSAINSPTRFCPV